PALLIRPSRDILQREPDAPGLSAWSNLLDRGVPSAQVISAFETCLEARTNLVQRLYRTHLGRLADPQGLSNSVRFLASGGTIEGVQAQLIGSAEYFDNRAARTNEGFLGAFYRD